MILQMKAVTKKFFGVKALDQVSFNLAKGEVHALLGENGAGKSTLMKIIAGIHEPDEGEIILRGQSVRMSSPSVSQQYGISIIHQELNLNPYMTVAENIFIGREPQRMGFVDFGKMENESSKLLEQLGLEISPKAKVSTLSIGEQQIVEILKALSLNAEILIMDEPTAVLTERESEKLFALIHKLKRQGVGIIYISHRLNELKLFCDRMTVLRDGKHVITRNFDNISEREIANLMVGRELKDLFPDKPSQFGSEILRVESLSSEPFFRDIKFSLQKGEILGFAGLIGAGRTELASAIFGDKPIHRGKVYYQGKEVSVNSPIQAVRLGFGFATEDRKQTGLLLDMSIAHNMTLPSLGKINRFGFIRRKTEKKIVHEKVEELGIKLNRVEHPVKHLSGGNQQKVVLAKWLVAETELFFLDEPTRGIDVGAKSEIYHLIAKLAAQGKGVIVISSELPELLGICNRIIVLHQGRVTGELHHSEASEHAIMALAAGV
ncbi:sugar ABC transporter ATP-binding protein [Paenibacillus sp. GCM10012307]|uniref:Sugar ABC transporter ATP-binding protein n=1 Tax=Paenibacillus roseus TaxID=2798579 RepID=A0A934J5B8_9BACL|nr:sugar ABC transporter ATP-binding protein [Paenibacillus roseus]MBJ6360613.1 sugar ABC transporter ATP-binding protein [Paenibacillus roseus]